MSSVSVSVSASAPPRSESYVVKALLSGSVCAFVAALVNPLDVVKIRMQNQSLSSPWPEKTMISGLIRIYRDEGIRGWCRGVNASILRELFYSSIRIGAYEPILLLLSKGNDELPSPAAKFASGLLSGGIGSALGNPTDLVKINFQALLPGGTLPYRTTFGAFTYIFKSQGVSGLYKGWAVTSTRSAILTSAQMGSYDSIKNNFLRKHLGMQDGYPLHLTASLISGLITTTAANPVDVIKTRYMSDVAGRYRSPLQCVLATYREGGIYIFFKGWTPSYCRLGPHICLSFLLIEQARICMGFPTI